MAYDFSGKSIAIVGAARSGIAAADVISRRGGAVTLYDGKSSSSLISEAQWADANAIPLLSSAKSIAPADIAIVSPGVRMDSDIVHSILGQGVELWGEIEAAYRLSNAPILAVTGTNGKTTTALLLAEMIRKAGVKTFAAGNIAAGSIAQPLIAAADLADTNDAIVAEISSFQLETIKEFRPRVAAILNITPDHQDRQTWPEYVAAKWRLFENQGDGDTAVLSATTPKLPEAYLPNDVRYFDKLPRPAWVDYLLIQGEHNRLNAIAASVMAEAFGIPEAAITEAALTFKGVVHRLEHVASIDGVTYINNSMCTNNAAFTSSLEAVPGSKVVLAGGVFKGGDLTPIAEAVAHSNVKTLVVFGRSGPAIAEAVKSRTSVVTHVVADLSEAVSLASNAAISGDTVILNPGCASFDQFKDFEQRGDDFKSLVDSLRKVASR